MQWNNSEKFSQNSNANDLKFVKRGNSYRDRRSWSNKFLLQDIIVFSETRQEKCRIFRNSHSDLSYSHYKIILHLPIN